MSNINLTCDVCGREVRGYTWNNGMRFCAKCYQETFGTNTKEITYVYGENLKEHIKVIEEKDKIIDDLEAKIAESEKQCRECKHLNKKIELNIKNKLMAENGELQKQLAEKEEQVKQLKLDLGMYKSVNEFINSYGIEKAREVLLQTEKTKNQDKISFAVEQLEKVKELLYPELRFDYSLYLRVMHEIDNQIKELKKEKINERNKV